MFKHLQVIFFRNSTSLTDWCLSIYYLNFETLFTIVSVQVLYNGQIIGAVMAETRELARKASFLVKVEYEDLPALLTIEVGIFYIT